jgi:hypothetical protein
MVALVVTLLVSSEPTAMVLASGEVASRDNASNRNRNRSLSISGNDDTDNGFFNDDNTNRNDALLR